MKPEKIKALMPCIGSKFKSQRPGWFSGTCPFRWRHQDGHGGEFGISTDPKKKSIYKCLSCGAFGDLTDLLLDIQAGLRKHPELRKNFNLLPASQMVADEFADMELKPEDIPDFEAPLERNEVLFPEQWLKSFRPIFTFPDAVQYCRGRGLSTDVLEQLDVRYDPQQRRVCFPFRNFKGELMGLQGRSTDKDPALRYFQYGWHGHRNMHVWLGEQWVNQDLPVVLCEGPFDLAKIFMVYPNVCASFTSGLSRAKVRRLADSDSIITFYDFGSGGDAAREAIDQYMKGTPILHIIPSDEDGDAGAMRPEEIAEALCDHVELPA
jgi:5S rRNA maturation endonuclease (ribonuclease M5)